MTQACMHSARRTRDITVSTTIRYGTSYVCTVPLVSYCAVTVPDHSIVQHCTNDSSSGTGCTRAAWHDSRILDTCSAARAWLTMSCQCRATGSSAQATCMPGLLTAAECIRLRATTLMRALLVTALVSLSHSNNHCR